MAKKQGPQGPKIKKAAIPKPKKKRNALEGPIREVPTKAQAKKDALAKKAEREENGYSDILPDQFYQLPKDKQTFILEYMRTGNGAGSVRRANSHLARQAANTLAAKWLNDPAIRSILTTLRHEMYRREAMDILETRVRIARHARSKITDVAFWDKNSLTLVPSDELDEASASAIREVSIDKDGNMKIKMHDSQKALEAMAKMHGLFKDDDTASEGLLLTVIRKLAAEEREKSVDAQFTEDEG